MGRTYFQGRDGTHMKPIIGVTPWEKSEPSRHYELGRGYCEKLLACGCVPLILPFAPAEDAQRLLSLCDGLLLSGGEDIAPALYGEQTLPACGTVSPERDAFEWALLYEAERRALPVLGICRGIQILNAFYGGTLVQDIESQLSLPKALHSPGHYGPAHTVTPQPGTRLAAVLGTEATAVNSSHHQCVKTTQLTVSAADPNGMIEAVEMPGARFVLGVQWHPERMEDVRLFAALADACRKGRG